MIVSGVTSSPISAGGTGSSRTSMATVTGCPFGSLTAVPLSVRSARANRPAGTRYARHHPAGTRYARHHRAGTTR